MIEKRQKAAEYARFWRAKKVTEDPDFFRRQRSTPEFRHRNAVNAQAWRDTHAKDQDYRQKHKEYCHNYYEAHKDDLETPERRDRRMAGDRERSRKKRKEREGNPELQAQINEDARIRQRKARRSSEKWGHVKASELRQKAKEKNLPFDLRPSDLIVPAVCPVFKTPFVFGIKCHPQGPSVDRLKPDLGYTRDNVRIICFEANSIKQKGTIAKIRAVLAYMEENIVE